MTSFFTMINQFKQTADKSYCDDMIEKEWMINRGIRSMSIDEAVDNKQDFPSTNDKPDFVDKIDNLNCFFNKDTFSYTDSKIIANIDGEVIEISRDALAEGVIDEQEINETIESVIKQYYGDVLEKINEVTKYASTILNATDDEEFELVIKCLKTLEQNHKRKQIKDFSYLVDVTESVFSLMYGELSVESKKRIHDCAENMILNLSSPIAAARALAEGKFEEFKSIKDKLNVNEKSNANTLKSDETVSIKSIHSPLLSEMVPKFLLWDEGGRVRNENTVKNYKNGLDILMCLIGDIPVGLVTKQHIKDVIEIRRMMPVRNKKPYSQWSIKETVDYISSGYELDDEADLVSAKTVKETFKTYQSFFSAYLCNELDQIQVNPTAGIKFSANVASYGKYSDSQMKKIVEHWKSQPDTDLKMVILAASYTGMRKGEVADLTSDRLRFDEDSGRYYIFIASGKTKAAKRVVPIANELVDIGFVDYVNSMPANKKLFSKKTDLITDALKKSREVLNIPDIDTNERRLVFHSLRHSVISKARAQGISDPILQNVVGHQTRKTVTDTYTHFEVKDLVCVVDCLDW